MIELYKTCGRCVHDEDDKDDPGSICYLCSRNFADNRPDRFVCDVDEKEN